LELLTINLASGETKPFRRAGAYFEIIDSTYAVDVNFYGPDGNSQKSKIKGALSGFFAGSKFGAFEVTNGSVAQTIQLLVCDAGESGGSRRQPGVVSVVDVSKARTLANQAFVSRVANSSAAGQYVTAQIFMPAISTKRAVVSGVTFQNSVAASFFLSLTSTAQATLGAVTQGASKLGGGAASVATTQGILAATLPGVGFVDAQILAQVSVQAGVAQTITFKEPVVLPPGWGLMMLANATAGAQALTGSFEFIEEPST